MKVNAKMNASALKTLSTAQRQALEMTGQQLLNDLRDSQTMPFDSGDMQNQQTYVDYAKSEQGNVSVVTDAKQARRLYFHPEYNFQDGKNANAGAGWFEPYINGDKTYKLFAWFKTFLRKMGGGYLK